MQRLMLLVIALVGAFMAHRAQLHSDVTRLKRDASRELLFAPDGRHLRVAASGFHVLLADLLWVRSVLVFGERWQSDPDPAWQVWLGRTVMAVTTLDERWRTPYFYGGLKLELTGDVDGAIVTYERAMEQFPDDFHFPFALGMLHYLHRQDADAAERWISVAAGLPGAPRWYEVAARGMRAEVSQAQTAIRYLREEIEQTQDPDLRRGLQRKLRNLQHDELSRRLTELREQLVAAGRTVLSPADLVGVPGGPTELPADPLGGSWVVDGDGVVRSDTVRAQLLDRSRRFERTMLTSR